MATILGVDLRSARKSRGKSLSEAARELGVDKGGLSRVERGLVAKIDVRLAWKIQDVYGIPIEAWRPKEDE